MSLLLDVTLKAVTLHDVKFSRTNKSGRLKAEIFPEHGKKPIKRIYGDSEADMKEKLKTAGYDLMAFRDGNRIVLQSNHEED